EFLRNDIFDARNPFAQTNPPFRLNQFGASLGGPLVRDKTFLFVSIEGLRQPLGQTFRGLTPSDSYRTEVVDPALRPLINAFPTIGAQRQANDPTTDLFVGLSPQRVNETSEMARLDHRFNAKTNTFLRFNVDQALNDLPLGNLRDRQVTN